MANPTLTTCERPRTVIWKFLIPPSNGYPSIYMPIGAKILTVQLQMGVPCLWVEVNPEEEGQEQRQFQVVGTGRGLSKNPRNHIGTWQDGAYVWHLFELLR